MGDTHDRGIYSKDVVYFRGFRMVRKKLEENPRLYNELYAGKITFKQCEWVEDGLISCLRMFLIRGSGYNI